MNPTPINQTNLIAPIQESPTPTQVTNTSIITPQPPTAPPIIYLTLEDLINVLTWMRGLPGAHLF